MEHDDLRPFAARWNLTLDGPVLDTPSSRIAFGCRNGSPVVLKVAKHQGDEADAHRALLHFARCACVRLLDHANGAVLLQRACALFGDLAASQGDRKLLHGDLHHDNILWDAARGWVAVDPKGVIGEPAYELGAMLRNPTENPELFALPSIAARRAGIIAEHLACDADRVLAWGFAQAVLSAVWALDDGANPARGMATAAAIWPLL